MAAELTPTEVVAIVSVTDPALRRLVLAEAAERRRLRRKAAKLWSQLVSMSEERT